MEVPSDHRPPKVFFSCSHESREHQAQVLTSSNRLRFDGIDTVLDQYLSAPPLEGWPRWMDRRIRDADFVLTVCTETYYRRAMQDEQPGSGLGVRWEGTPGRARDGLRAGDSGADKSARLSGQPAEVQPGRRARRANRPLNLRPRDGLNRLRELGDMRAV